MKIERRIIDDLKTERPDVAPALPVYFRLIPIFFYATLVGGILLSIFFFIVLQHAATAQRQWLGESAKWNQMLADTQAARGSLEKQVRRANDVVAWGEGAHSLEPLVVTIIRSIDPETSSIMELGLVRDANNASQIKMTLKLNAKTPRQLDVTLDKIAALNFRAYSPNQTQSRGEVDYEATLIYQGPRSAAPAPASTTPAASSVP